MPYRSSNISRVELVTVRYREDGATIEEMMAPGFFPAHSGFEVGENLLLQGSDGRALVWVSGTSDSRDDPRLMVEFVRTSRRPGRKPGAAEE